MPPQIADMVGGETMTVSSLAILPVQYAGDDSVRVMSGQTADEGNRVLVGASVYGADCVFRLTVRPNVLTCQPPNQPLQLV